MVTVEGAEVISDAAELAVTVTVTAAVVFLESTTVNAAVPALTKVAEKLYLPAEEVTAETVAIDGLLEVTV